MMRANSMFDSLGEATGITVSKPLQRYLDTNNNVTAAIVNQDDLRVKLARTVVVPCVPYDYKRTTVKHVSTTVLPAYAWQYFTLYKTVFRILTKSVHSADLYCITRDTQCSGRLHSKIILINDSSSHIIVCIKVTLQRFAHSYSCSLT